MGSDVDAPVDACGLDVSLLGPLRARRDGAELVLGGRRQRAVLARLALAAGEVVATERLVDELWLGEPPPSATNTLQSYVSVLRGILGPGVDGRPAIERVGEGYRLALPPGASAASRFEDLVARSTQADAAPAERLAALDRALALWHGSAVADFADEPWAQGHAVRLDELRLAALGARFELLLDAGRHASVVGDLEAAVAAHPLREGFTAQLVTALYRCGRQAEALRAFERLRAHLGEELGLDPSPELAELASRVLDHDPDLAAVPGAIEVAAEPGTASSHLGPAGPVEAVPPPVGPLALPPAVTERRARTEFVGRTAELAELEAVWRQVEAGDRQLVALAGEPGMGKTRLAQRFARWVHDQGGHVLWGRCTAENLIAYQPAVEAIRTALRSVSPERSRALVQPRPALGLLLPDLATGSGDGDGTPTPAEQYGLYEALADLVGDVAASAPLMFVVDDLQWADLSTLGLIEHLLRSDRTRRLLVVGTVRRPAGRPTPDLDRLLADLRRDQRLLTLSVDGLGPGDVARLLAAQGIEGGDELAATVARRTGGNPFFVESLADQGGDLARADARSMPDSVRDLLDQRLGALDAEASRVLTAAAVIGLRVDLGLLGSVSGLAPDRLLDVVDAAVLAGLLAEDEDLGWVTFPHALVRQALIARTTRNREAQLHLKVADAVESGPDVLHRAATLAQHLLDAGRACPPERASAAAIGAGRHALFVLADEEARTWAARALEVLDGAGIDARAESDRWRLRAEALMLVVTARRHLGDREAALATAAVVIEEARSHGDALLLAAAAQESALATAGVGFSFGARDDRLIGLLEEALAVLPAGHPAEEASLLAWSSIALSGSVDEVAVQQELSARARSAAAELAGRPDVEAITLLARRLATAGPVDLEERLEARPGLLAASRGWFELEVAAQVVSVVDLLESDQVTSARAAKERLRRFLSPYGRPAFDAYVDFLDACFALLEGDLAAAADHSNRGLEAGEPFHCGNALQAWSGQQFMAARERGTLAELVPMVAEMVEQFPSMPVWRTALASCLAAWGDHAGARAAYQPLFVDGELTVMPTTSLFYTAVGQLAEVCWVVGDADAARVLAQAIEPHVERLGVIGLGAVCLGPMHRPFGHALAAAGDLDGAARALGRAAERCEADGFGPFLARSLADRATVLEARSGPGDRGEAAELRQRAEALATDLAIHLALA
ncbi:BTAD domain-containing putative transcriptional regulator [soil metagenome]